MPSCGKCTDQAQSIKNIQKTFIVTQKQKSVKFFYIFTMKICKNFYSRSKTEILENFYIFTMKQKSLNFFIATQI